MKKLLIISSDEGIRESLKIILGDTYKLIVVDSFDDALSVCDKIDINLMLVYLPNQLDASLFT